MESLFNKKLNDDTIFHIFSFLTPKDLLRSTQVCKRWQYLAESCWSEIRVLDIDQMIRESSLEEVNANIINVLQKCSGLQKLIAKDWRRVSGIYEAIAEHCSKLNTLLLCKTQAVTRDVLTLAVKCSHLKKIYLVGRHVQDDAMSLLFSRNSNLESVSLRWFIHLDGSCFKDLPQTLKELHLRGINNLDITVFVSNIAKLKHLESLSFKDIIGRAYFRKNIISMVANVAPNLKHLTVTTEEILLESIGQFKHLKSLNLYKNVNADDKILRTICESCQELEVISLGFDPNDCVVNTKKISVEGLAYLAKLTKLREVNFSRLIINQPWASFISNKLDLKTVRITNCSTFDDYSANEFVRNCTNLTVLELSGNGSISQEVIHTAARDLDLQPERRYRLKLIFNNEKLLSGVDNSRPYHPLLDVYIRFSPQE